MDKLLDKEVSEFLSVKELAGRLRVSSSTVYSWVELGIIPNYKVRKKVFFRWAKVEEWLKEYYRPGRKTRSFRHSGLLKTPEML